MNQAAATGLTLNEIKVEGRARTPDASPAVTADVVLDVTAAAVVAPGQYRRSLALGAFNELKAALASAGAEESFVCGFLSTPDGEIALNVTAVIQHEGTTHEIATFWGNHCYNP